MRNLNRRGLGGHRRFRLCGAVELAPAQPAYEPDGRLSKLKLGNDLWETRQYGRPGEATLFKLGTNQGLGDKLELEYNFHATQNNGNLLSHVIRHGSSTWWQKYEYDGVNRLICAAESTASMPGDACSQYDSWRQTYGYDQYGNRWVPNSQGFSTQDVHEFVSNTVNPANNRLNGSGYDAAGNLTTYTPYGMFYDAENRMLGMTSEQNGSSWFYYDGEGRRIKKVTTIPTNSTSVYVYDATGRLAAEYSTASGPSGTSYLFTDLLGTTRAITGPKPEVGTASILECSDYSPFGRLAQNSTRSLSCHASGASRASQKFTGQVRDETLLDYFGARYFSGAQGRFTSPDAPFADQNASAPQSWNLYTYVRNNPLSYVDRDGRKGHHVVPQFLWSNTDISAEAFKLLDNLTLDLQNHNYTHPHPTYNKVAARIWTGYLSEHSGRFMVDNKVSLAKMTAHDVETITKRFAQSPEIRKLLPELVDVAARRTAEKVFQADMARAEKVLTAQRGAKASLSEVGTKTILRRTVSVFGFLIGEMFFASSTGLGADCPPGGCKFNSGLPVSGALPPPSWADRDR